MCVQNGCTALISAAGRGQFETVELLLSEGAKIDEMNNVCSVAFVFAFLFVFDFICVTVLCCRCQEGHNALMRAAKKGQSKCIQVLLNHGADVNKIDAVNEQSIRKSSRACSFL